MKRRDTPAARAALATRRRRAASNAKSHARMVASKVRGTTSLKVQTVETSELPVKEVISSPGRGPNRIQSGALESSKSQSNIPRYNQPPHSPKSTYSKLRADGNIGKQPLKEAAQQNSPKNHMTSLTQRAIQSRHRSTMSSGGTLTTTGLTLSSASRSASQDKTSAIYSDNDNHDGKPDSHSGILTKHTSSINSQLLINDQTTSRNSSLNVGTHKSSSPTAKLMSKVSSGFKTNSNTTGADFRGGLGSKSPRHRAGPKEPKSGNSQQSYIAQADGIEHSSRDSPLHARMRKMKASEASNLHGTETGIGREGASPSRPQVAPTGRGAGENPLLASRRKRAAQDARRDFDTTGRNQAALNNDKVQTDTSPDQGPLSDRRIKMEAASPRRAFEVVRSNAKDDPIRSTGRKLEGTDSIQHQYKMSYASGSPLHKMTKREETTTDQVVRNTRKLVLSPREVSHDSPQSRSLFEDAFRESRRAVSPSRSPHLTNEKTQPQPLLRNISPRRPNRQRTPVRRNKSPSPPRQTIDATKQLPNPTRLESFKKGVHSPSSTSPRANTIHRHRPPPINTNASGSDRREETTSQIHRIKQLDHQNLALHGTGSESRNAALPEKSSPYRSPTKAESQPTATSPGVQQLSAFLMDSSSATEMSTIPEQQQQRHRSESSSAAKFAPLQKDNFGSPFYQGTVVRNGNHDNAIAADASEKQLVDSACLYSGSIVMLKAYCNGKSIRVLSETTKASFNADPSGHCLSRDDELLEVTKVLQRDGDSLGNPLRQGDTVVFRSTISFMVLGVRKVNPGGLNGPLELGFFGTEAPPGSQWTLLTSKSGEVDVGKSTLDQELSTSAGNTQSSLLRSGNPILLRHVHTGGILSINLNGSLVLLTDSYGIRSQYHESSEDPSLLRRLQQHSKLLPSRNEMFQLVSHDTPPCPVWVSGRDADERTFLTGSYLMHPQRNQRSAEFEADLFAGSKQSRLLSRRRPVTWSGHLGPTLKEKILLDEVIGSFLGLEGKHIRLKWATGLTNSLDDFEFQLFDADGITFDVSLRNLVDQILPLSTSFIRVRNFSSSHHPGYEYGKVMHAFCEGLDGLLQDYVAFVSHLERQFRQQDANSESLTMKNAYFQITSSLHSMSILEHATKAVAGKKGGALLNALRTLDTRVYMGDVVAKKVLTILFQRASVPYMDMMTTWLQSGTLQDPYGEFMIEQTKACRSKRHSLDFDGDAWSALFVLKEEHVLEIVASEWHKQKVLTTGKYWNAVHACHTNDNSLPELGGDLRMTTAPLNSSSSVLSAYIDSMYQDASRALVHLLLHDFKLMESLHLVKRYFLLDQGDFLMNFLDVAETELLKESCNISLSRVQHWLSMSIQVVETPGEDEQMIDLSHNQREICKLTPASLRCRFCSYSMIGQLDALLAQGGVLPSNGNTENLKNTGIEAFVIDFARISFPTSLVLSRQTMENYKLLFRQLFFAKHVERRLVGVWRDHQSLKSLQSLRGLLGRTFLLRQRMLHFLQNLLYYMSFEVIESNWSEMLSSIDQSGVTGGSPNHKEQTVDDILGIHTDFLRRTMDACLLTNRELFQSLTKLMQTCLLFSDQMKRFMETTRIYNDNSNIAIEKRRAVQRNLNDRGVSRVAVDKKSVRRSLASSREEREAHLHRQTRRVGREVSSESYVRMVARFEEVFIADLSHFMVLLNSHTSTGTMANLGNRLSDYNFHNGYPPATMTR